MFIRITQHYYIMQKFNGGNPVHICDECRTIFYPGDTIVELCKDCASTVWCVFNTYEDGSVELSSIHHNQNSALTWIQQNKEIFEAVNPEVDKKIIKQETIHWFVL